MEIRNPTNFIDQIITHVKDQFEIRINFILWKPLSSEQDEDHTKKPHNSISTGQTPSLTDIPRKKTPSHYHKKPTPSQLTTTYYLLII